MKALLLVDIQNDFLPGGALPAAGGDRIISIVNKVMNQPFDLVLASKDWHPADHESFAPVHGKDPGEVIDLHGLEQTLWPPHCVQGSWGSDFPETLDVSKVDKIIFKGTDKTIDSYSAFFDNARRKQTNLHETLKEHGIRELYVVGIATDYCVKFTVLDALDLGYDTTLIADACCGIELKPGDIEKAIDEMKKAGAEVIESGHFYPS